MKCFAITAAICCLGFCYCTCDYGVHLQPPFTGRLFLHKRAKHGRWFSLNCNLPLQCVCHIVVHYIWLALKLGRILCQESRAGWASEFFYQLSCTGPAREMPAKCSERNSTSLNVVPFGTAMQAVSLNEKNKDFGVRLWVKRSGGLPDEGPR